MITHPRLPLVAVNVQREYEHVVAQSLSSLVTIEFLASSELDHFLATRRTAIGFLVALARSRRSDVDRTIRQVRLACPVVPIIACAEVDEACAALVVCAIQAGADHLALRGFDDLRPVLRHALGDPLLTSACAETLGLVLPWVPADAHRVVSYGTMHAPRQLSVAELCEGVGVSERSLHRLLHNLALPTPASTISWCRLFVAAHMMAARQSPTERVAGALGFGSGSGLRNMLRRYTGLTPVAARDPQVVARLAQLYREGGRSVPY
jgi:AraC-like DNA-binding protein